MDKLSILYKLAKEGCVTEEEFRLLLAKDVEYIYIPVYQYPIDTWIASDNKPLTFNPPTVTSGFSTTTGEFKSNSNS